MAFKENPMAVDGNGKVGGSMKHCWSPSAHARNLALEEKPERSKFGWNSSRVLQCGGSSGAPPCPNGDHVGLQRAMTRWSHSECHWRCVCVPVTMMVMSYHTRWSRAKVRPSTVRIDEVCATHKSARISKTKVPG